MKRPKTQQPTLGILRDEEEAERTREAEQSRRRTLQKAQNEGRYRVPGAYTPIDPTEKVRRLAGQRCRTLICKGITYMTTFAFSSKIFARHLDIVRVVMYHLIVS